jgi:hypothetical protein
MCDEGDEMPVDITEDKFRRLVKNMDGFGSYDYSTYTGRRTGFPAWRSNFATVLGNCHCRDYRLPTFDEFVKQCKDSYTDPVHKGKWWVELFRDDRIEEMMPWLRMNYESGMSETYVYVCLTDILEDVLDIGLVMYDPRIDWKQKFDCVVTIDPHKFGIDAHYEHGNRRDLEAARAESEKKRKKNRSWSSHFNNKERLTYTRLEIERSEDDTQEINGLHLFSINSINRLLREIYDITGIVDRAYFPIDIDKRANMIRDNKSVRVKLRSNQLELELGV